MDPDYGRQIQGKRDRWELDTEQSQTVNVRGIHIHLSTIVRAAGGELQAATKIKTTQGITNCPVSLSPEQAHRDGEHPTYPIQTPFEKT